MTVDSNGESVYRSVRREPDGSWSAVVWSGHINVTNVRRQFGYPTRRHARAADISESAADTVIRLAMETL